MDGKMYGYIRVSTKEQHEDRQRAALDGFGVPRGGVFADKLSGKNFDRPAWKRLINKLRPDDLLVVKSIDRLGRDCAEIIEQWRVLTKEKKVNIVVLDMPLLDTRREKNLLGSFVSDLILQILSFVAENERAMIRQRQAEGIRAAKARGVKFGRPSKKPPRAFQPLRDEWKAGRISAAAAAKRLGVSHHTFLKWAKQN